VDFVIRPARPGEENELARINIAVWKTAYAGIMDADYLASLDGELVGRARTLRVQASLGRVLVAERENRAAGFAAFGPARREGRENWGEIYALYILDEYQRKGAGRSLVSACAQAMRALGRQRFMICCLAANGACAFYDKLGGRRAAGNDYCTGGREYPQVIFEYSACPEGSYI
jgi:GNAT superfamily N-acetyltransferase